MDVSSLLNYEIDIIKFDSHTTYRFRTRVSHVCRLYKHFSKFNISQMGAYSSLIDVNNGRTLRKNFLEKTL